MWIGMKQCQVFIHSVWVLTRTEFWQREKLQCDLKTALKTWTVLISDRDGFSVDWSLM